MSAKYQVKFVQLETLKEKKGEIGRKYLKMSGQ
jgi:hypothetical protein